ncbi:MAG: single-stranded-DNA-specific exonuclease RecJ [Oscillospiraceae bacterium]|nr:single-stranded-DNA-specific exonuclease RecJ [Oscillospiraceae bacterium]
MIRFRKWKIAESKSFRELSEKYKIGSLSAKVAAARLGGISEQELFSHKDYVSSPFELADMDRAVERINEAVDLQQKIVVYGDYDADGVTATVILTSYLEAMGADVSFYIPSREGEGYGLNKNAIRNLSQDGCQLIITVDNGVAAVDEIEFAKELGIDVVVADHHMPQAVLPNCIVVDPHREDCPSKFKDICGAFVAFKLVAALDGGDYEGAFEQYAELVALATIADIVPLVDENRTIVRLGLERMRQTDNLGLCSLINSSLSEGAPIDSGAVSYGLVPRINAAGRMGSAMRAAQLLLCEDDSEAERLSSQLCADNAKRKNIETEILDEIEEMSQKSPQLFSQRVIVVCGKGWHHGVLGIVASKLVEKTGKPAIVLSEDNGTAVGSGRSVEGFELFSALTACSSIFERFGGHSLAAGVTVASENIGAFREKINEYAAQNYPFMPQNELQADAVITPEEITLAAVKELSVFEPFGKSNPAPLFALLGVCVQNVSSIGNGNHTRLSLTSGDLSFTALYFGMSANALSVFVGHKIDLIVRLKPNVYNGTESVTIQVVDLRPSGIRDDVFFKEKQLFEAAAREEELTPKQAAYLMPTHDEAADIYRALKQNSGYDKGVDILWWQLSGKINRARLSVIIEAFCQSELAVFEGSKISLINAQEKHDLWKCKILSHIAGYLPR